MKKLEREDLYKLIYMVASATYEKDRSFGLTPIVEEEIGKKFKDIKNEYIETYVSIVKKQVINDDEVKEDLIDEYAEAILYNNLIDYYHNPSYLEDFEEKHSDLLPFVEEELKKENDEFYKQYQSMQERKYDFEQEEKSLLELDKEKQQLEKIERNVRESLNQHKEQDDDEITQ